MTNLRHNPTIKPAQLSCSKLACLKIQNPLINKTTEITMTMMICNKSHKKSLLSNKYGAYTVLMKFLINMRRTIRRREEENPEPILTGQSSRMRCILVLQYMTKMTKKRIKELRKSKWWRESMKTSYSLMIITYTRLRRSTTFNLTLLCQPLKIKTVLECFYQTITTYTLYLISGLNETQVLDSVFTTFRTVSAIIVI